MKGCSRLERLDFVEQTAFNSGYLKVTVSAAGWGCHFMLQDFKWQCQLGEFPNPSLPWWVCTLFVLTPCASASTCGSVLYESWVMWVRNARKHSLPHLWGYFLSTSVQWYRTLRPHTLAEQERRVGDGEVDVLWDVLWAMEGSQQWVLWGGVVCSQQIVCLQPSYLPVCIKTLNEAKLDVRGTAGLQKRLQKGSFCYTSEIRKQSLMNCS